jgi:hypothetical protein
MERTKNSTASGRYVEQGRIFCRMRMEGLARPLPDQEIGKKAPTDNAPAPLPALSGTPILPSTSYPFVIKPFGRLKTRCGVSVFQDGLRLHLQTKNGTETIDIAYWNINSLVYAPERSQSGHRGILFFGLCQNLSALHKTTQLRLILDGEDLLSAQDTSSLLTLIRTAANGLVASRPTKVILTGLNPITAPEDVELIGALSGKVLSCEVKPSNPSSNAAIVEYGSATDCAAAIRKLDKVMIDDRRVRAEFLIPIAPGEGLWKIAPIVETIDYERSFFCSYGKDNVELFFSEASISNIWETKPICIHLRQIEIVYFERSQWSGGVRTVDAVFVYRDFWNQTEYVGEKRLLQFTTCLSAIPMSSIEKVKDWLTERGVKYYSGTASLRWGTVLKSILQSADTFWDDTAWAFLSAKDEPGPDGDETHGDSDFEDKGDPSWDPSFAPPEESDEDVTLSDESEDDDDDEL